MDREAHWEKVYNTRLAHEHSWFDKECSITLNKIENFNLNKDADIIDIGCGDAFLLEKLLSQGYENLYGLDISASVIKRAKERLGDKARQIHWIIADLQQFETGTEFELWHDRAVFHFLNSEEAIAHYVKLVSESICHGGHFLISCFSPNGPTKCSGIEIRQYGHEDLALLFSNNFQLVNYEYSLHETPNASKQDFVHCTFVKK